MNPSTHSLFRSPLLQSWQLLFVSFLALLRVNYAAEVIIDCSRVRGEIRALHGANFGPLCANGIVDLTRFHREIALPSTRLHDIPWTYGEVVDIHSLFRNFDADPADPASYDFRRTDDYLAAATNTGTRIVFRLGESIEHTPRKYWVHPPRDFAKWAQICAGVIRHYNEGWAGGFRHGIREWEIWNEPENQPACWTGSDADYYRLYEVTATALKDQWPDLRIGGPAVGNTGRMVGGRFEPSKFVQGFLAACRDRRLPLDFFSWHIYTDEPGEAVERARSMRALLDRHGFTNTTSHLNEWNYLPGRDWSPFSKQGQGPSRDRLFAEVGGPAGAAFAAAMLVQLQDAPVDMANYFSADNQGFGLFTPAGTPRKNYFAFKAFRELLEAPQRLEVNAAASTTASLIAGISRNQALVQALLVNTAHSPSEVRLHWNSLPWPGGTSVSVGIVDSGNDLKNSPGTAEVAGERTLSSTVVVPGPGLVLVTLKPTAPTP